MFMDEEPKDWSEEDADEPQPEFEDLTADEQAEQALREADETMEWLKEYGPELAAQGMDVPKQLAELQQLRESLVKSHAECANADERLLQSIADKADAMRVLFETCNELVESLSSSHPFDPEVAEFAEFLEEWKKHMPKKS